MEDNFNFEFCGFFWGEGCADIQRFKRGTATLYRPRLRIHQRADEVSNLYYIQDHLGGAVHYSVKPGGPSKPAYQWQLTERSTLLRACEILLSGTFPSKKRPQVEILVRAIHLASIKSSRFPPETLAQLDDFYLKLRELKLFSC